MLRAKIYIYQQFANVAVSKRTLQTSEAKFPISLAERRKQANIDTYASSMTQTMGDKSQPFDKYFCRRVFSNISRLVQE